MRTLIFVLESAISGVFLWLGLYLVTRDNPIHGPRVRRWWQSPAVAIGVAMICAACVFAGIAMQLISDDPRDVVLWARMTWWPDPFALSALLWGVFLLITDEETSPRARLWYRIASLVSLVCASFLSVVGMTTNLVFRFDAIRRVPRPPHYLEIPHALPGSLLFDIFVIGTLLIATFLLFRRMRATQGRIRGQLQWLGAGMALMTLGVTIAQVGLTFPRLGLPPEPGDMLLVVGLLVVGDGVARHNALLQHQVITRDFYRSLAGVVLTSAAFVLLFSGLHWLTRAPLSPESVPLLVWLAILTVTLRPWVGESLDRIFLSREVVGVRRALQQASEQLVTAEDQHQALVEIEHQVPETITATLEGIELRELQASIGRDINELFQRANYTGSGSDDYIIRNTGLLDLAIVEDTATALMVEDGVSPVVDREHYRLKALRQIIQDLVQDMSVKASLEDATGEDLVGDEFKRQQARYTILRKQFIEDAKREDVQRAIEDKFGIGSGGAYGRLLQSAKKDLAKRLYLAERRTRETRGGAKRDVAA